MANVYVEARPKGRIDGSPITDYVVEDHADPVLETFKTQHDTIAWAKSQGHSPLVARVRELTTKRRPITGDQPEAPVPPEVLEPVRRQRLDGGADDRPMTEPAMDRPRGVARANSPIVMTLVRHQAIQEVFLGRPYALPADQP